MKTLKFPLFTLATLLFCFNTVKAQDKPKFDRLTLISTAASIGMTIADTEGSYAVQRQGYAHEANGFLAGKDGRISRPKSYAFSFGMIGGSLVLQRLFPKAKPWLEGLRFGLAGVHGVGFAISRRF